MCKVPTFYVYRKCKLYVGLQLANKYKIHVGEGKIIVQYIVDLHFVVSSPLRFRFAALIFTH